MTHKLIRLTASIFLCLVFISASFFPVLAAPPTNDNFDNAEVIPGLPFSAIVDVTDATSEAAEPHYYFIMPNTVWYSFTPSQNMQVQVDTLNSSISSMVSVYSSTGPGFSGLWYIGSNYYSPTVNFTVQAGKVYYLQAGGFGNAGNIQINVAQIPPPANDNFEDATPISLPLPFTDSVDTIGAGQQPGEPWPSCSYDGINNSIWYAFTSDTGGVYSASIPSTSMMSPIIAVYTGSSLENLTQLKCINGSNNLLTFQAEPGVTYYFQVGKSVYWDSGNQIQFHLDVAPPPYASFDYGPWDPSIYDTVYFGNMSNDPAGIGIQTTEWDFGDGSSSNANNPLHTYAADGDYQVTLKVTTIDGRTDTTSTTVEVRTHDVAITKVLAPKAASVGQTREIYVYLRNSHYLENVRLEVYKSVPGGMQWIDTLTLTVPVLGGNRLTTFSFRYSFTAQDAQIGKVSFQMQASMVDARDALPMDNTAISSPTRVSR